MKALCCILIVMNFALSSPVVGQENTSRDNSQAFVEIPSENVMILIANQSKCPLRIESATFLMRADARNWGIRHTVLNASTKTIRSFSISAWNTYGNGGSIGNGLASRKEGLVPGQKFEVGNNSPNLTLVPITDEVRRALVPLGGKKVLKTCWVLVVDQVVYDDGSVYEDYQTSRNLSNFFDTLQTND